MSENVIAKQLPAVYQRRMLMAQKDKKRNYRSNGNREYKSDVISMMLQIPEYALDVYNAMNDSAYTDPDMIQIMRLENGISLSVRNDASFFISNYLNLYEHQSTYSPNAPLRFLIYLTNLLKKLIGKRDLYGRKRVQIATPHFAVFYNGTEKRPEKEVLKLSDAFINRTDTPEIELTVTVYNINPNNNTQLLEKSEVLRSYMIFVNRVRENLEHQKKIAQNAPDDEGMFLVSGIMGHIGFQVLQGLYAIGAGGLFGTGLGNSLQKLGFLPEAQNDMIFSIICEELGLFGAVLIIFLLKKYRIIRLHRLSLICGLWTWFAI